MHERIGTVRALPARQPSVGAAAGGRAGRRPGLVVSRLILPLLLFLGGHELGAQGDAAAIPVAQRYDPVTAAYFPVVLDFPPAAVRTLQRALAEAGHSPGPVTGSIDNRTRASIRDFQSENGLRITGQPDYETVLALGLPVRRATAAEVAEENRRPLRGFDVVVIGASDSIPTVGGIGAAPGAVAPAVPGAGAPPGQPGVEPVPAPGVAPEPGVGAAPAPAGPPPAVRGPVVPAPAAPAPTAPAAPAPAPPAPTAPAAPAPPPGADSLSPR